MNAILFLAVHGHHWFQVLAQVLWTILTLGDGALDVVVVSVLR